MSKQKTIWHVGAWNRNYGDQVLQASIRNNLMNAGDIALNFVPVDCQNSHFFQELIEVMNAQADLLLVGGGGLIFNRREDNSLSGWQFSIRREDIDKINIPLVIYGIGFNKFHYDQRGFKDGTIEHLNKTLQKAALFSVRNQGTKRQLTEWGLDTDKIEVIPDAGSFLDPVSINIPGLCSDKLKIGINLVSDRPFFSYPEPFEESRQKVMDNLGKAFSYLIQNYNAQVILIEHIADFDNLWREKFQLELGEKNFISIEDSMPHLYPPSLVTAPFLVDIYRQMDLVIGMRGHANIIPFGTGTPFIGLSSHNKNRFFLEEIGEPKYLLDIRDYETSCSVENIIGLVLELLKESKEFKKRIVIKKEKTQVCLNQFNKRILQLLK